MNFKYLGYIALLFCVVALNADPSGLFSVNCNSDLSAKFLVNIFGSNLFHSICTNLPSGDKSYLPEIFAVFSQGLLTFAGGFITYTAVTTTLSKASDGGQAAPGSSNPWVPMRLATGVTLLTPTLSGYSVVQVIVMWSVVQGVGLADSIWNKQVDLLTAGVPKIGKNVDLGLTSKMLDYSGLIQQRNGSYQLSLAKGQMLTAPRVYAIGVCLASLKKANDAQRYNDSSVPNKIYGVWDNCPGYNDNLTFCAGSNENKKSCGVFTFNSTDSTNAAMQMLKQSYKQQISYAFENAGNSLMIKTRVFTDNDCVGRICNSLKSATNNLATEIKPYLARKIPDKHPDNWGKDAKNMGWIASGQYYYKFQSQLKDSRTSFDLSKLDQYMAKVEEPFSIKNRFDDSSSSLLENSVLNKLFSSASADYFAKLVEQMKGVLDQGQVAKSIAKDDKRSAESMSSNDKSSPIYKASLALKNNLVVALKEKPMTMDLDNSVFSFESQTFSTRLTAPLDNLLVMLGMVANDFSGLNIRANNWVKDSPPDDFSKNVANYGACRNGNDFISGCRIQNSGIIGYLFSYFDIKPVSKDNTTYNVIDPLTNITNIGRGMLQNSMDYWVNTLQAMYDTSKTLVTDYSALKASLAAAGGIASAFGSIFKMLGGALSGVTGIFDMLYSLDKYNLGVFLPMGVAISGILFTMGVVLGIYVPLIPFMVFAFTAVGWLMAVIEAMIAAPLVALGVTHPQGHDLLGKAEQAVILLLGIFIRPSAIMLGFVASIALLKQILILVNIGFLSLTTSLFSSVGMNDISMPSQIITKNIFIVGIMMVYVYILLAAVNQVFSLIYQVPEKLMRWIGAAPDQSGVAQMVGEVKQGMQSAGQQLGQGGQQMASNKPDMAAVDSTDISKSGKKMGKGIKGAVQPKKHSAK